MHLSRMPGLDTTRADDDPVYKKQGSEMNMVKRYGFVPFTNAFTEQWDGQFVTYQSYAALEAAFSRWKAQTSKDVERLAELNAIEAAYEKLKADRVSTVFKDCEKDHT